jgi:hypothetical protein
MKKMTKQQAVVEEEERTRMQAVLATLTMQRCANKLAKRWKGERERERKREGENAQKSEENVISLYNIEIYIFLQPFFYSCAIERRCETTTFKSKI